MSTSNHKDNGDIMPNEITICTLSRNPKTPISHSKFNVTQKLFNNLAF